jgi:hypothetical protein
LYSVIQSSDGGYAVAGSVTTSEGGNNDMWLAKLDSAGNLQWNQTYNQTEGGKPGWWGAWCVIQTSDGGYALGGSSGLVKVDSSGNLQWSLPLNGTAYFVVQTSDGGYAFSAGDAGIFFAGAWLSGTDPYSAATASPSPSPSPSASQQPTQPPVPASPSASASTPNLSVPELSVGPLILAMVVAGVVTVTFIRFKSEGKASL